MTDCNHIYDEHDLCFECNKPRPYNQVDADRRYRTKQKASGIVRKTVLVPENRVAELHALLKEWRKNA